MSVLAFARTACPPASKASGGQRQDMPDRRAALYAEWLAARRGTAADELLARMLASWQVGAGVLPNYLGLSASEFARLLAHHFPRYPRQHIVQPNRRLDAQCSDEMNDLHTLLLRNRSGNSATEIWLADILIAGCLGNDHLWQDLGLWQRADLSQLMHDHFAPLAQRNCNDMKWKKFLYKQLCETEGVYTCRAPSCAVCVDYHHCFGAEQ